MPWSAVPDRDNPYITKGAWKGTDNDSWWLRWKIPIKGWFAFGPLAKEKWARFREYPIVLFGIRGKGFWRFENTDGSAHYRDTGKRILVFETKPHKIAKDGMQLGYLSRIQPWCRWSFFISWPLFVHFHGYYRPGDVMAYPETNSNHLNIFKMLTFAFGFKRDASPTYWLTTFGPAGRFE